jgi:hypothetical protein
MKWIAINILVPALVVFTLMLAGAITHEKDMIKQCKETGWIVGLTVRIQCSAIIEH